MLLPRRTLKESNIPKITQHIWRCKARAIACFSEPEIFPIQTVMARLSPTHPLGGVIPGSVLHSLHTHDCPLCITYMVNCLPSLVPLLQTNLLRVHKPLFRTDSPSHHCFLLTSTEHVPSKTGMQKSGETQTSSLTQRTCWPHHHLSHARVFDFSA